MRQIFRLNFHDSAARNESEFDISMRLGFEALATRDLELARLHFLQAHVAGHDNLVEHIEVHRARLLLAWKETRPFEIVKELYSIIALYLLGSFQGRKAI
jgi:hypothetical protein